MALLPLTARTTNQQRPTLSRQGLTWSFPKGTTGDIDIPLNNIDDETQVESEVVVGVGAADSVTINSVTRFPDGVRLNVTVGASVADGAIGVEVTHRTQQVLIPGVITVTTGGDLEPSAPVYLDVQAELIRREFRMYDCVVDPGGNGDYTSFAEAVADGNKTFWLRKGIHPITTLVNLPNGCYIGSESSETILFCTGAGRLNAASSTVGQKSAGTIAVTNNDATVIGTGTAWDGADVGRFIRIGQFWYKIAAVTTPTEIELAQPYRGETKSGESYLSRSMYEGLGFDNFVIASDGTSGDLLTLNGVLDSTLERLAFNGSGDDNLVFITCGGISGDKVISRNAGRRAILMQSSNAIKFENIRVDGAADTRAVHVTGGCDGITLEGGFIGNIRTNAVEVDNSKNVTINGVTFSNFNVYGVFATASNSELVIDGCTFDSPLASVGVFSPSEGTIVSDCTMRAVTIGVESSSTIQVTGCQMFDVRVGVNAVGDGCVVSGNEIFCRTGPTTFGVTFSGNNVRVTNNRIDGGIISGIQQNGATAVDSIVTDNHVTNCGFGIRVNGTNQVVENNTLSGNVTDYFFGSTSDTPFVNLQFQGRIYNRLVTTDATVSTLATIPFPDTDKIHTVNFNVSVRYDAGNYAVWQRRLIISRQAAALVVVDEDSIYQNIVGTNLDPNAITYNIVGTNLEIQIFGYVVGIGSQQWTCSYIRECITPIAGNLSF